MSSENIKKIALIGLGYVGLPLLKLLSKNYTCIGLDSSKEKINSISSKEIEIELTSSYNDIKGCDVYIVAVPTPIDRYNEPELSSLKEVCINLSKIIAKGALIIFESTVAPGTTEEFCVPLLEDGSKLKLNQDFYVAYSPERVNVGDILHTTESTPKVISASCNYALDKLEYLYSSVITAPLIRATSIKVAEAAKMYENVQRDTLIALANEYAEYCKKEEIDIEEVTRCASSKWNFSHVNPGLVGGHCIGVDPYYLLSRARSLGIEMPLVSQSRQTNENKVKLVTERILIELSKRNISPNEAEILLLGFAYKKDTGDIRNTKIAYIITELTKHIKNVVCYDYLINKEEAKKLYNLDIITEKSALNKKFSLVIRMVDHKDFFTFSPIDVIELSSLL